MTTPAKINKANRKLVEQLNTIFQDNLVEYSYHYEKAHWVNGYDGNEGFELEDNRTTHIRLDGHGYVLHGEDSSYRKTYRIFTFEEFHEAIKEEYKHYPNSKALLYANMKLDENLNKTKKEERKARVKI